MPGAVDTCILFLAGSKDLIVAKNSARVVHAAICSLGASSTSSNLGHAVYNSCVRRCTTVVSSTRHLACGHVVVPFAASFGFLMYFEMIESGVMIRSSMSSSWSTPGIASASKVSASSSPLSRSAPFGPSSRDRCRRISGSASGARSRWKRAHAALNCSLFAGPAITCLQFESSAHLSRNKCARRWPRVG